MSKIWYTKQINTLIGSDPGIRQNKFVARADPAKRPGYIRISNTALTIAILEVRFMDLKTKCLRFKFHQFHCHQGNLNVLHIYFVIVVVADFSHQSPVIEVSLSIFVLSNRK
jgi:hypothetical protein